MKSALVVFSGGQDSTTCLYWALKNYDKVYAVTFDYAQRHRLEIESARRIASFAGVHHEIIDLGPVFQGLSPLTNKKVAVEKYAGVDALPDGIAQTFVPGRNILFFTVAANRAFVLDCDAIVVGVAQQDFGGYPDCRQDFISKLETALESGLERKIKIEAPLMNMTKKETVELAKTMPGCIEALAYSTTCYEGQYPPCSKCHSCLLRQKGFDQANTQDPLRARFLADSVC